MDQPKFENVCQVYIDPEPNRGDWNMAVDELLLQAAVERGQCSVRVYRWVEPTISLGYFQRLDDVPSSLRKAGLPVVRRLSGGGMILHHHELTYSCAVPACHELARSPKDLYVRVHECIIRELSDCGIRLQLRGTADAARREEFLCFARGDSFDVVMGSGHKVVGSAQRRRKGAILQHGSLVLRRSEFAPQFLGIEDLAAREVSAEDLIAPLAFGLAAQFESKPVRAEFTEADLRWLRDRTANDGLASVAVF